MSKSGYRQVLAGLDIDEKGRHVPEEG